MTMLTTIQVLRGRAEVANDEHNVKVRTGQFAELHERLAALLEKMPLLNAGLAEVEQLDVQLPPGRRQEAERVAKGLRGAASDASTMTASQSLDQVKAQVSSAEKYVRDLNTVVKGAWDPFLRQREPVIDTDLLDALAEGGVDVEEIRSEFESAKIRLAAISGTDIPRPGAVESFRTAVQAIERCGENLGKVVDHDIAEGIVECQNPEGLPLRWFTSERLEKIRHLGILDRFKVRLR